MCEASTQRLSQLGKVGEGWGGWVTLRQQELDRFTLADKYKGLEKNVWVEFIQLALEYQPLNLGQGLPDDLVPTYVVDSLRDVVNDPSVFMHQYTRGFVSANSSRQRNKLLIIILL